MECKIEKCKQCGGEFLLQKQGRKKEYCSGSCRDKRYYHKPTKARREKVNSESSALWIKYVKGI